MALSTSPLFVLIAAWTAASTLTTALASPQLASATSMSLDGSNGSCSAVQNTLTSTCGGVCGEGESCLIYDANAVDGYVCTDCTLDDLGVCEYECFETDIGFDDGSHAFIFLVTFGSFKSDAEVAERTDNPEFDDQVEALPDWTIRYESASDDQVEAVGKLDLPVEISGVYICGGNSCIPSVRGKMALVSFTDGFVADNERVTDVGLYNLFLGGQIDDLPSLLPAATMYLTLANVMLLDFPSTLESMTQLNYLQLDYNYIKTVDSTGGLDKLRYLYLQYNLLDTFDVNFPYLDTLNLSHNYLTEIPATSLELNRLVTLDLGDNQLTALNGSFSWLTTLNLSGNAFTEVPPIVFELNELTEFYFAGNPLATPSFTLAQIEFLNNLTTLDIEDWNMTSTDLLCDVSDQVEIRSVTVCRNDLPTPTPTPTEPNPSPKLGLIIGIAAGGVVLLLVVIAVVWCCIRRRHRNQKSSLQTDGDDYYDNNYPPTWQSSGQQSDIPQAVRPSNPNQGYRGSSRQPVRVSSSVSASSSAHERHSSQALWNDPGLLSLQLRSEDIQDVRVLGAGAYGVVWLVQYRESEFLASKRLKRETLTRARTQEFVIEIKLVAGFSHPNIVRFVGAAWHNDLDLQALFEYMENGDLRSFLLRPDVPHRWTPEKLQLAIDMVEALVYVHSFSPPLVHRDLKSRNVLVSGELRAKLTDFGVSRFRSSDSTMTMGVGTSRWLAPEVISGATDYDQSSDVFSVGVVLSELDTHELPYDDAVGPTGRRLEDVAILQRVASGALRPSFSARCPSHIVEIAHLCMAQEQANRPSAAEVAYVLRTFQRKLQQEQQHA